MPVYPKEWGPSAFEDLEDDIAAYLKDAEEELANERAAEGWSTPTDEDEMEAGGDLYVVAHFGDAVAVNGDLVEDYAIPEGYEDTYRGGEIPTDEMELEEEHIVDRAIMNMVKDGLHKKHVIEKDALKREVQKIADQTYPRRFVYTSVSGESEIYARRPDKPEIESDEGEIDYE